MSDEMIVFLVVIAVLFCVSLYAIIRNIELERQNDTLRKELMSNYRKAKDK